MMFKTNQQSDYIHHFGTQIIYIIINKTSHVHIT